MNDNKLMLAVWTYLYNIRYSYNLDVQKILEIMENELLIGRKADFIIDKILNNQEYHQYLVFIITECNIIPEKPSILHQLFTLYPQDLIPFYHLYFTHIYYNYSLNHMNEIKKDRELWKQTRKCLNMPSMYLHYTQNRTQHLVKNLEDNEVNETITFLTSNVCKDLFTEFILYNSYLN